MGKNKKSSKKKQKYTVDDLLDRVSEYVDCFQFDLAVKFCEKALQLEPSSAKVLQTAGNVYADIGDVEGSRKCFLKAVEVEPNHGHEKYMYLGQMSAGEEAKTYYLKGIEIMKNCLEKGIANNQINRAASNEEPSPSVSVRDISNAYCALAEIFMTDSCQDADAEEKCGEFCNLAVESDKTNPEAYIALANFLLSKEDKDEASKVLLRCFELLKLEKPKSMSEGDDSMAEDAEVTQELDDKDDEIRVALYASRTMLAKLLIEVEEYEKAETVLSGLLEENDEDIEVWYMLGWNMFLKDQLSDARFFLTKAVKLYEKLHHEDEPLLEHIKELLEKCPAVDDNDDDDDGDGKETAEETEEMETE